MPTRASRSRRPSATQREEGRHADGGIARDHQRPIVHALEQLAEDLDGWIDVILSETDYRTGRPFALDWQAANGTIEPTKASSRAPPNA